MAKPFYRTASMDCWTEALSCKFFSCPILIPHKCELLRMMCEPGPLRLTQGRSSSSRESLVAFMGGWWESRCPRCSHRQRLHAGWGGGFSAAQGTLNADARGASSQERPRCRRQRGCSRGALRCGVGRSGGCSWGNPLPPLSSKCPGH